MALSRERIAAELLKLLVAPGAVATVTLMLAHGILTPVLPEIADALPLAALADAEAQGGGQPDPIRRLAALLPRDPALGESIANRLKLSKAQRARLVLALTDRTAGPHEDAYRVGIDAALDRLLLTGGDPAALQGWAAPRLPITGGALVARGLSAGPLVARALRQIEDQWIAEAFPPAARVDAIADAVVNAALDGGVEDGAIIRHAADASSGRA